MRRSLLERHHRVRFNAVALEQTPADRTEAVYAQGTPYP
jgi:hypothetical protein